MKDEDLIVIISVHTRRHISTTFACSNARSADVVIFCRPRDVLKPCFLLFLYMSMCADVEPIGYPRDQMTLPALRSPPPSFRKLPFSSSSTPLLSIRSTSPRTAVSWRLVLETVVSLSLTQKLVRLSAAVTVIPPQYLRYCVPGHGPHHSFRVHLRFFLVPCFLKVLHQHVSFRRLLKRPFLFGACGWFLSRS